MIDALERAWGAEAAPSIQRRVYLGILLAIAIVGAIQAATLGAVFPVDDAYITLHNATVLFRSDPSYAGTSALVGATSGAHVLLVALFSRVLAPASALLLVSWLAIAAYATGLARLVFARQGSVLQAVVLMLVGLTAGHMVFQLLNGLETGLALALLVWTLATWEVQGAVAFRAAACATMPFVRPELGAFALLIAAHEARFGVARRRFFVIGAGVLAAWAGLYISQTGSPFPSTISAKRMFFAEGCLPIGRKFRFVVERAMTFEQNAGVVVLGLALLGVRAWRGRISLAFIAVFFGAYFVAFPRGLDQYLYRYCYTLFPFALYACASSLRADSGRRRAAAAFVLVLGLGDALAGLDDHVDEYFRLRSFTLNGLDETARWASANLPPGSRVLVHDAGYFSYATTFPLVDVVGLKTPSSAAVHAAVTWPTCGKDRDDAIARIATASTPEYLVSLRWWPFHVENALRQHGWQVDEVHHAPIDGYDIYRLSPPTSRPRE